MAPTPPHKPASGTRLRRLVAVLAVLAAAWVVQSRVIHRDKLAPLPRPAEPISSRRLAPRSSRGETVFERLGPDRTGIDFACRIDDAHPRRYLYETGFACGGVAIGDVDGDGRPDLYFVNGPGTNRLYRQTGDFRFDDATKRAGVDGGDSWGGGAAMADVNNDGRLDIYVCNYDSPNQLYINQGDGVFEEQAHNYGLDVVDACLMAAFCDYDLDGDLDAYILTNRYIRPEGRPARPPVEMVGGRLRVKPEFEKYYALSAGNDLDDRAGRSDALFRNNGDGTFSDVSAEAGLWGRFHGLSAAWWDYNEDGWPDVYVANDFNGPDQLFRNNADGTFSDVTRAAVPRTPWFSMGSDIGDVDNDGRVDLLVADMSRTTHLKRMTSMGPMNGAHGLLETFEPRQTMWNALFLNTGTGRFMEVARLAGVASTDWTWAVKLADFDNDSRVDLFFANGFTRDFSDDDHPVTMDMEIGRTTWDVVAGHPELHDQSLAFRNRGELRFEDVSRAWGLNHVGMSMSAAYGDLDRDGDLDLIVSNVDQEPLVYRNQSSGRAVLVALDGAASNRFGLGATVRVRTAEGSQVRWLSPMTGYSSSNDPLVHFGLGDATTVEELTVQWPSGRRQTFRNLAADCLYTFAEPDGERSQLPARRERPRPWFQPTQALAGAGQRERPFDDFRLQPLLPRKLSQLGPGMAWSDIDGDGDDDVFIGGPAGSPGALWENRGGGRFVERPCEALTADRGCEDMGAVWFDADSDSDFDLFVASGGVEHGRRTELLRDRLYLNDGQGALTRAPQGTLPELEDSGGPVAAADFDRDGDLDLFVGGRVLPGKYPMAPASRLLRNDGGRFADVTQTLAPDVLHTGMATAALWTDVDNDGWVDLLVTHDWGPVKCFGNRHGKLVDMTEAAGLNPYSGWWNSIAGGDFDGDGDIDYVAANFGLNSNYRASPTEPARLYYGDFADLGTASLIEAYYDGGRLVPLRDRMMSSLAVPWLIDEFPTHEAFGRATLEQIYSQERLNRADAFSVTTLESGVFLNDGRGVFEFRPLPRLAQAAPGFGLALFDGDADGCIDVFIAQNFHGTQPGIGRLDGGIGLLLRGDGRGGFSPLPPAASGIVVPGDAKSATTADLDGDGLLDLAVGMNDAPIEAFVRSASHRGAALRVRLRGGAGNPTAVGSRVTVQCNDAPARTAEVYAGEGYLSQSSAGLEFGLGAARPLSVTVRWPDGEASTAAVEASQKEVVIQRQ